ncbi:hypothetical protein NIES4103_19920 [Nostoc sp. NIES-4103]|nr:hypothetical protein NIES4103_19920 [Nostoc sp. NIES-4103]
MLKTDASKQLLSENNGTVAITEDLIKLDLNTFYTETFGNECFITDVTVILNEPLNIGNLVKAIAALAQKHIKNLQLSLDRYIYLTFHVMWKS